MDGPLKVGEKPDGDDARSWLMGVNLSALGRPFPRVSRKDYHLLIGNEDEEKRNDDVLYSVLAHAFKPGSEGWNDYLSNRRGRREPLEDGTGCYTVGRVAPPRHVPKWEYKAAESYERSHPGVKQYSLAMTMADTYVRQKYDVPQTLINSVRDLALTCPADAAATMQEYIQSRCTSVIVRVVVGSYAEGVTGSKTVLAALARKFSSCHSTQAELNGNKLFINSADDDGQEWCVFGPVKYAESIRDVFVIASNVGKHETIHLYSSETARLGIDISIEGELVSPEILGHGRDMLDLRYQQASGVVESLEPEKAEIFESLKVNIIPAMDAGVHCSTALQLQNNVALVNQHVVDDGVEISIRGKALLTKTPVGDDLWAVHSKGVCQPWKIRPAVPGELASIMYFNGMEVTLSAVFRVAKNDGQWLLSEMVEGVYPGMSGGAVVAMEDMALLGIHCGEMRSKLKAAVITDTLLADSYDFVTETDDNRQPNVVSSDVMVDLIKKRGLSEAVLSIVSSMRTVETVGGYFESSGVVTSEGKLVAACGEGQRNVTTHEGLAELADFSTMANGMLQVASVGGNASYTVRTPQLGETAVAIVLDAEGPQITDQLKVVHVGPQGRNMQLGGFADGEVLTVKGACVMSLQDGAVLGVVVRAVGSTVFCLRPPVAEAALRVADEVGKVFPRLNVSAWEASKLTGVMAVQSDTSARMARIGESALRYRLVKAYAENPEIPKESWDSLAARSLTQSSLVDVCMRFQLHTLADLGPGEVRDLTSSEMATLVLAFVGLVDRYENDDAVKAWLEGVNLLDTGDVGRPALVHRSSGFNVLSDEGDVLPPADYPGSPVASEW